MSFAYFVFLAIMILTADLIRGRLIIIIIYTYLHT